MTIIYLVKCQKCKYQTMTLESKHTKCKYCKGTLEYLVSKG